MPDSSPLTHAARIQDQFSRQAVPFAELPAHSNEEGLALLARTAVLGPDDDLLDVACGPGLVACAFAPLVRSVRGLDVVEAMLSQAKRRASQLGISNAAWDLGSASELPYADASFSKVLTRYSFHHLLDPYSTLAEMRRVCRPGGSITVCDVAPARDKLAQYDALETIRDPSHTHALCPEQHEELFARAGLSIRARAQYRLEMAVEDVVSASFPEPGGAEKVAELFRKDVGVDALGVGVEERQGRLWFAFPILILSARKP